MEILYTDNKLWTNEKNPEIKEILLKSIPETEIIKELARRESLKSKKIFIEDKTNYYKH